MWEVFDGEGKESSEAEDLFGEIEHDVGVSALTTEETLAAVIKDKAKKVAATAAMKKKVLVDMKGAMHTGVVPNKDLAAFYAPRPLDDADNDASAGMFHLVFSGGCAGLADWSKEEYRKFCLQKFEKAGTALMTTLVQAGSPDFPPDAKIAFAHAKVTTCSMPDT